MIVDGPTTLRNDGSTVCIGYGKDTEGRVTVRFALPKGSNLDAPESTESLSYVGSMADLPDIHDQHRLQE